MKRKLILVLSIIITVASVIAGLMPITSVYAGDPTPTTEITIRKYDASGTKIAEVTKTYQQLEATLPVQGNGVTHYYTQGPTFVPDNLTDPDEVLNLKDKGALKGTDIKDLCSLVGGANPGDTIKPISSDGYGNDQFQWENVYNPDPKQGKMVICWYNGNVVDEDSGLTLTPGYVPAYTKGMLLAFFAQTTNADGLHVFGPQDMVDCLPSENWHTYTSGSTVYYSANGLYAKAVRYIDIYTNPNPPWSLPLNGMVQGTKSQREFENCVACHSPMVGQPYTYTEGGNTWSGLPLWYLQGLVDDNTVLHGIGAYNDAKAEAPNYSVKVNGKNGSGADMSTTIPSSTVVRNNSILVANKLNGASLPSASPLRLVGQGISTVNSVTSIELTGIPTIPQWELDLYGSSTIDINNPYTLRQSEVEDAEICSQGHSEVTIGNYKGMPLWYLCGWVDDGSQHGDGAFNDDMALVGYNVRITPNIGQPVTIPISSFAHQSNLVLANKMASGQRITDCDPPLRVIGSGSLSGTQISGISRIELLSLPHKITATTGTNGSISPVGPKYIAHQGSQTYSFTPNTGYKVARVTVDGTALTGTLPGSYQFSNVIADHTIAVTFVANAPAWDLDGNGVCNILDISSVASQYLKHGSAGWIPQDLIKDGVINILDISAVASHYLEHWN
jgi:hypothetical protein